MDTDEYLLITNMAELEVGEEYYVKTIAILEEFNDIVFDGIIKIIDKNLRLDYINIIYNEKEYTLYYTKDYFNERILTQFGIFTVDLLNISCNIYKLQTDYVLK